MLDVDASKKSDSKVTLLLSSSRSLLFLCSSSLSSPRSPFRSSKAICRLNPRPQDQKKTVTHQKTENPRTSQKRKKEKNASIPKGILAISIGALIGLLWLAGGVGTCVLSRMDRRQRLGGGSSWTRRRARETEEEEEQEKPEMLEVELKLAAAEDEVYEELSPLSLELLPAPSPSKSTDQKTSALVSFLLLLPSSSESNSVASSLVEDEVNSEIVFGSEVVLVEGDGREGREMMGGRGLG
ncbi:hypothetical protein BDY24DRAFT_96721 [Mrakia frigida]|uniref:uncharacterized protein n=1 Tax=Mrakia frigida TaxID=29902 RepID=UPI003FCBF814